MNKNYTSIANDRWVFVDLEMTGLDEQNCSILQIAMIITDQKLRELASADIVVWQPESNLQTMIPLVREMHTKNGLLDRVRRSKFSVLEAERQVMELLTQHVKYRSGILAGNSMYVDRRFMQKYMPSLESYLHYRQLDVSSIKIACQEWYGEAGKPPKLPSNHTALEDIRACIEELKFYRENCFR